MQEHGIGNDLFELGGIDNVGNAVGITFLSAIGAKILLLPVSDGRHLVSDVAQCPVA